MILFLLFACPRVSLHSSGHGKKVPPRVPRRSPRPFGQKKGPRQSPPALLLRQAGITPPLPVGCPDESGQALI